MDTATFSVTGVLAARSSRIDLFGILVIGVVTAVGGGTLRDIILDVPVFWIHSELYLGVAGFAAVTCFFLRRQIHHAYPLLLYLDALGAALFATMAVNKTGMESFEAKGDGLRRTDDQYTGGPGTAKVKYARGCTGSTVTDTLLNCK